MLKASSKTQRRMLAFAASAICTLAFSIGTANASPSHDAWLTTKTKIALLTSRQVPSNTVHVDTNDGQILLHGSVATQVEKENVESIAKNIAGVTGVRNLIEVIPASRTSIFAISDEHIQSQIETELQSDSCLATGGVSVKSVDKGIVVLVGKTRNLSDYLMALEHASKVPGVRGVMSAVKSVDTIDNIEGFRPEAGANCDARDSWITMSTKMKLIGDRVVPALAIGVDTRDGNVTLFGIVPTTAAKDAAGMDAKNTDGVRSVTNDLQVVASANREMVNAKDEIVTVKTALQAQSDFKHINVSVKNGVARLTGKLPSGWRRLDAVTLVRATTGVRSVDDELRP